MQDRKSAQSCARTAACQFEEPAGRRPKRRRGKRSASEAELADKAARRAAEFYASADPENVVRLRQTLMRAGYLDPDAVGKFFLVRFARWGRVAAGIALIFMMHVAPVSQRGITLLAGLSVGGYFVPAFMLKQR
jgi:tight adherence protein C